MGLWDRVRRRSGPTQISAIVLGGEHTLEVVGESAYQDVLWRIVGGFREDRVRHPIRAILWPEPENPQDPHAIVVLVEGQGVGYLSREDAFAYGPGLATLMAQNTGRAIALEGVVVGGGRRPDGIGFLGVFLEHDPADFGFPERRRIRYGQLRTGLSEAIATDLEDDSYDLSWMRTLTGNDARDVELLHAMLHTEGDPIDRHYMFCQLERCLYRRRDELASALDEFDAVCRDHDSEMGTIRRALFEKFRQVPVIEMYQQAAIRCQKSRDWTGMQGWAQRGLAVYASDAARPEAVADLQKRLDYATVRLSAPTKPVKEQLAGTVMTPARPPGRGLETLICGQCGIAFQRLRTRGRKPKRCPECRGGP